MTSQRILILSTPVGPLGSGTGGGVELTLHSLVLGLTGRGHQVEVLAPAGSLHVGARRAPDPRRAATELPTRMAATPWSRYRRTGSWRRCANGHASTRTSSTSSSTSATTGCRYYLTPFFVTTPLAHLVSMATLTDAMDDVIVRAAELRPRNVAMHSHAQADTFPTLADVVPVIGNGIAVERYDVHVTADEPRHLGFIGRISPEKGLEDVVAVAERTGLPLKVWGLMQDRSVWDAAIAAHPGAQVSYEGFLPTDELQEAIGGCAAIVMAPKWVEAFGNVAIEAMATGVPVISYRRGGPAEIITDGKTGFLVEPDDVDALVDAVGRIDELDRVECRQRVEEEYSIPALAARVEKWLDAVIDVPSRLVVHQRGLICRVSFAGFGQKPVSFHGSLATHRRAANHVLPQSSPQISKV